MKRLFSLVFILFSVLIAGCVETTDPPVMRAPPGVSAEAAFESFLITGVSAEFVAERCGRYGIRKNFSSRNQLIRSFEKSLTQQGYSRSEIEQAIESVSVDVAGQKLVNYFTSRRVKIGDENSLCRFGQKEIDAGTSIGRLLRN